jgi:hypothetical protein
MTLFSPDLYRSFGIGFAAGALIVVGAAVGQGHAQIESPAQAAAPLEAPQPSAEFLIEPLEVGA